MLIRISWVLAVLAIVASNPAQGQAIAADSLRAVFLDAQGGNRMISVHTATAHLTGRVQHVYDSGVRVANRTIEYFDVQRLEVRFSKPDPLWNGVLIGAGLTGALLGTFSVGFAESMRESTLSAGETLQAYALAALIGAALGGAVDAAAEPAPQWRIVFNRK